MQATYSTTPETRIVPIADVAARFHYRDVRYFKRHVARQKLGLHLIRVGNRWYVSQAEVEAYWARWADICAQDEAETRAQEARKALEAAAAKASHS